MEFHTKYSHCSSNSQVSFRKAPTTKWQTNFFYYSSEKKRKPSYRFSVVKINQYVCGNRNSTVARGTNINFATTVACLVFRYLNSATLVHPILMLRCLPFDSNRKTVSRKRMLHFSSLLLSVSASLQG